MSQQVRGYYKTTVDRTADPPKFDPITKVWSNVLIVALSDLTHPTGAKKRNRQKMQKDARYWLTSHETGFGSCVFVCELVGVPIAKVRAMAAEVPCLL